MKKLLLLLLGFGLIGCDQNLNIDLSSSSREMHYCTPTPIIVSPDNASGKSNIRESCNPGDSMLLNYIELGDVNYDAPSDYEYRPVSVINRVCDHSKEIVIVKVIDSSDFNNPMNPNIYRSWDISCIYSGHKDYRFDLDSE